MATARCTVSALVRALVQVTPSVENPASGVVYRYIMGDRKEPEALVIGRRRWRCASGPADTGVYAETPLFPLFESCKTRGLSHGTPASRGRRDIGQVYFCEQIRFALVRIFFCLERLGPRTRTCD